MTRALCKHQGCLKTSHGWGLCQTHWQAEKYRIDPEYRERDGDKIRAAQRERYKPEEYKRYRLLRKFNLTLEDYQEKFDNQNGVCAICEQAQESHLLAVDHNHSTGKIRGLLCSRCNLALGQFEDDIELLDSACRYLYFYEVLLPANLSISKNEGIP